MNAALTILLLAQIAADGRTLRRGDAEVELPCVATQVVEHGGRIYAACPGTIVVLSQDPLEVREARSMPARVEGLHIARDRVWVELLRREAIPLADLRAALPAAEPGHPAPEAPAPVKGEATGRVVEVQSGVVVIDLGSAHGVSRGDRVELYITHEVSVGAATSSEEERLAVGIASAVSATNSRVRLGRNERVALGVLGRPTRAAATSSMIAPPRIESLWSFGFVVRPLLALGAAGGGAIADLRSSFRHEVGFAVHAGVSPLGIGIADDGDVFAFNGHLIGSYDHQLFEVGFGAGWASISDGSVEDTTGLGVEQLARLGAVDGLHLQVRNTFLLYDGAFHYGGTEGIGMVPVTARYALFGRGAGGRVGHAFGELGLRVLGFGNGDRGSVIFDATLGFAGLFGKEDCTKRVDAHVECTRIDYAGPMVGFGVEWRR